MKSLILLFAITFSMNWAHAGKFSYGKNTFNYQTDFAHNVISIESAQGGMSGFGVEYKNYQVGILFVLDEIPTKSLINKFIFYVSNAPLISTEYGLQITIFQEDAKGTQTIIAEETLSMTTDVDSNGISKYVIKPSKPILVNKNKDYIVLVDMGNINNAIDQSNTDANDLEQIPLFHGFKVHTK